MFISPRLTSTLIVDMLALLLLTIVAVIRGSRSKLRSFDHFISHLVKAKGDTHEVQLVPEPELRIVFIGIVGPRSSGKKKLGARLAEELQSPLKAITTESYFRAPADMPIYRAPGMEWDGEPNYAHPESVRLADMYADLRDSIHKLNEAFTRYGRLPDSVILERATGTNSTHEEDALNCLMSGRNMSALPKTHDGQHLVFIVASGLFLYRYKPLVDMMDYKIWMTIDNAVKMSDRYFKKIFAERHGGQPLETEDVLHMMDFRHEFRSKYFDWWFPEEATQKINAGWCIEVDARKSLEEEFSEAKLKLDECLHFMRFRDRRGSEVEDENSSSTDGVTQVIPR